MGLWMVGQEFDKARDQYGEQLSADLLIKHHLHILYEQLLEANLVGDYKPVLVCI